MADERWISFPEATELVRARLGSSIGRSEAILKEARRSGEIRLRKDIPLLMADDGVVGMDMRPGAQNKGGVSVDAKLVTHSVSSQYSGGETFSEDDLLDWLDRHHPQAPAADQPKRKGGRPPSFDRDAVAAEVRRLMEHHGEFSADDPEWNAQARLIEAVRKKFGEASDSTWEPYIKAPLAAWRSEKAASPKT